jgi:hypothetical protein
MFFLRIVLGGSRTGTEPCWATVWRSFRKAKMTTQYLKYLVGMILLVSLGGCGAALIHNFVPTERDPFEAGTILEFSSRNEVALQNGQESAENISYLERGAHSWFANRQQCTTVAIAIVRREISKRGMQVVERSPRTMTLSVESMRVDRGFASSQVVVKLSAKAGNSYSAEYEGTGNTGPTLYAVDRAADVALSDSVAKMLGDPKIVEYLTK